MIDDEYEDTIVGTPQGREYFTIVSEHHAHELDKELEARGLDFVRYADYTEVETMPKLSFRYRKYQRFRIKISA